MNEFLILNIAILLAFFVQSATGFAAGLVAIPIMLLVLDLQTSIAILGVLFVIFTAILVPKEYQHINKKVVARIIPGSAIGMIIGLWVLTYGDPLWLKKGLGVVTILFVLYRIFLADQKINWLNKMAFGSGLIGGFFSGLYNSGSPPLVMYIVNRLSDKEQIRATLIGALGFGNVFRIPLLTYNDLLSWEITKQSFTLVPALLISILLGQITFKHLNRVLFNRIVITVLLLTGVTLIIK